MPFHFTCPACGHDSLVADQFEGRSGPCTRCGQLVTVPRGQRRLPGEAPRSEIGGILLVLLAAGVGVLAAIGVLLVAFQGLRPVLTGYAATVNRGGCKSNLKQIGAALLAYHQQYGKFPPAYIADDKGVPKHSWRVLILPFMGNKRLYDRYSFEEAWDGTNNAAVTLQMPTEFACPADHDLLGSEMSYRVVVGKNTLFPGAECRGLGDITDDPATTILVVEMTNTTGLAWLNPTDLRESAMTMDINSGLPGSLSSHHHPPGVHVLTADGKVHFLPDTTGQEVLRGMVTIAGGEYVTPEMFEE